MINKLDEENITDSDFSVMITNLPRNLLKEQIREIIRRAGVEEDDLVYINMCYKFSGILPLKKKEEHYVIKIKQLEHFRKRLSDECVAYPEEHYPPPKYSCFCPTKEFPNEQEMVR